VPGIGVNTLFEEITYSRPTEEMVRQTVIERRQKETATLSVSYRLGEGGF
jgi:hypothetical protein